MNRIAVLFVGLFYANILSAGEPDSLIALLNRQLGVFQVRFQELMALRQFEGIPAGEVDTRKLTMALNLYAVQDGARNTSLLFYHNSNDTLYSWVISAEGIQAMDYSVQKPEILMSLESGLKNSMNVVFAEPMLADRDRGGHTLVSDSLPGNFYEQSAQLSRILFPPAVASALKKVRFLILVPELNIAALPIYALQPFGNGEMLVDNLSISIAHSLDEFLERVNIHLYEVEEDLNLKRNMAGVFAYLPTPLIVGNPDFSLCPGFKYLPGAQSEAALVAEKYHVSPLLGKQATKNTILDRIPNSSFIYLATHGVADPSDPMNNSAVVLAGDENGCGLWNAKEIQSGHLNPNTLVVLSACQTGLGKVLDAGIIGLGRAFILAGASNVVMSLWSVGDQSTKELMDIFTDELFVPQHFFPAENLRQAILKYRAKNPNPADWAAFIQMGTPYPPGMTVRMGVE